MSQCLTCAGGAGQPALGQSGEGPVGGQDGLLPRRHRVAAAGRVLQQHSRVVYRVGWGTWQGWQAVRSTTSSSCRAVAGGAASTVNRNNIPKHWVTCLVIGQLGPALLLVTQSLPGGKPCVAVSAVTTLTRLSWQSGPAPPGRPGSAGCTPQSGAAAHHRAALGTTNFLTTFYLASHLCPPGRKPALSPSLLPCRRPAGRKEGWRAAHAPVMPWLCQ